MNKGTKKELSSNKRNQTNPKKKVPLANQKKKKKKQTKDLYLALFKYFVKGFFFLDLKKVAKFQKLNNFHPNNTLQVRYRLKNHYK